MNLKWGNFFVVFGAALVLSSFFSIATQGQTAVGDGIEVNMTVPSGGGGGDGGGGGQTDSPPQINNVTTTSQITTARVSWTASDDRGISGVLFEYGLTSSYGLGSTPTGNYQVDLSGLAPATIYYFRISAIDTVFQTSTYTGSFQTRVAEDVTAPTIRDVVVIAGMVTSSISWQADEPARGEIFFGREVNNLSSSITFDILAASHTANLTNLVPSTRYYFRIVATDAQGNSGRHEGEFVTSRDATPPSDVQNLVVTAVGQVLSLSWLNPPDADFAGVRIVRKIGSAPVGMSDGTVVATLGRNSTSWNDTQVNPNIRYYYTVYSFDTSNNFSGGALANGIIIPLQPSPEVCNNTVDDDGDGFVDCGDMECQSSAICQGSDTSPTSTSGSSTSTSTTDTLITVPDFLHINFSDLFFRAANRQVVLQPVQTVVTSLSASNFTVGLQKSRLYAIPLSVQLLIDNEIHLFNYNVGEDTYYTDVVFPTEGIHLAMVVVEYGRQQRDVITFQLSSLARGVVRSSGERVRSAEVKLFLENGSLFDTSLLGFENPQITKEDGSFGWVVPNGKYYVAAERAGYYQRITPVFTVRNNVVSEAVELIPIPEVPIDAVLTIVKQMRQEVKDTVRIIEDIKQDEEVQETIATVVVPTVIGVTAATTAALISWTSFLPFLKFLFLQPLLLLGWRRRKGWGQVYNALNKLPIDLAMVRLVNFDTGKLVQTKVTDKEGRYAFVVAPGKYRIEVFKNGYMFPSDLLKVFKEDGRKLDLYHGEAVIVNEENAVITANIPLDPVGQTAKLVRIYWQRFARALQLVFSWLGIIITVVSLYLSPRWYVWVLLIIHLILLVVFRRLALPPKIKSWGIVYDETTKRPVGKAVARLFSAQFNKLVSTQVTDSKGRYYFLAGDNDYYITYEHPQYRSEKTSTIDLKGKEPQNIVLDVGLKKKNATNPTPTLQTDVSSDSTTKTIDKTNTSV